MHRHSLVQSPMASDSQGVTEIPEKGTFDSSFWGPEDNGLAVLMARMKGSKRTCEQLLLVLRERAAMEEDYGKRLLKLSKNFKLDDEEAEVSFTNALEKVKKQLYSSAQEHLSLGEAIRKELETPLAEFIDYQSNTRRSHRDVCEKLLKTKIAQESALLRAKEKYEAKSIELLQFQGNSRPALNAKDAERMQAKLEKATIQVSATEQEYRVSSNVLQETFGAWEKAFKKACGDCERMEVDRYAFLREKIWHWMNLQSSLCVKEDEGFESVRAALEECDFEHDLEIFLARKGTGSEIKRPPVYVPFSVDSKAALDAMTVPITSGPTYNMNSFFSALGISRKPSTSTLSQERTDGFVSTGPATTPRPLSMIQDPVVMKTPTSSTPNLPHYSSLRRDYPNPVSDSSQSLPLSSQVSQAPPSSVSQDPIVPLGGQQQANLPIVENGIVQGGLDIVPPAGMMYYDPYDFSKVGTILFSVRVLFDYQPQAPEELTLSQGQILAVFKTHDDGWWEAVTVENGRKRVGLFPSNFTQVMP